MIPYMRNFVTLVALSLVLLLIACNPQPGSNSATPTAAVTPSPAPTMTPAVDVMATVTALGAQPSQYNARVLELSFDSEALGIEKSFHLYLPPGYEDDPNAEYPVLYLFRGHEDEWINPRVDASRGGETVIDAYEDLLAAGDVGEMILVFPGMSSDDNAVPSLLTNMQEPELAVESAGIGTGQFESYFIGEMIPFVDGNFFTSGDPAQRGVDGFSLGGYMAIKIAAQHPDLFGTAGAFDGLYFYSTPDCQLDDPSDIVFDMDMFDAAMGDARALEFAAANNAPTLICAADPAALQSIEWFIQYGPAGGEPDDANHYRGAHLLSHMEDKGISNGFEEPILEGGHRWATADEHMRQTLPLHWQALSD